MKDAICVQQHGRNELAVNIHTQSEGECERDITVSVCMWGEKEPPRCWAVDLWNYGLYYDTAPGLISQRCFIFTGGRRAILGSLGVVCPSFEVTMAIGTAFPIGWPHNAFGPPGQLSAQFSCKVQKTDRVFFACVVMRPKHPSACYTFGQSHLSDTRPAGTLSASRSRCWSRRRAAGCARNGIKHECCELCSSCFDTIWPGETKTLHMDLTGSCDVPNQTLRHSLRN